MLSHCLFNFILLLSCCFCLSSHAHPDEGDRMDLGLGDSSSIRTIHVIPHTHWDREWYQSFEEYRKRLLWFIDHLLSLISKDPNYKHFHFDGQSQIFEDYLQIRPEKREELLHALKTNRFSFGPWTTSPDEFLSSGESIIRNLASCFYRSEDLGVHWNRIGYMADTFGHIGQLPQIFSLMDIHHTFYGRGLDDPPFEHYWRANDGSMVFGVYSTYCLGGNWEARPDIPDLYSELLREYTRSKRIRKSSHFPYPVGCDHTIFHPNLTGIIQELNSYSETQSGGMVRFVHSSLEDYFDAVEADLTAETFLPLYEGEQRFQMDHLSWILSNKVSQKQANWRCLTQLEKYAEPLRGIAWGMGFLEDYDQGLFQHAWSHVFQNHAHDSIGGCSVESVHHAVDHRFRVCEDVASQMSNEALLQIATRLFDGSPYSSLSPFPYPSPTASPSPRGKRKESHTPDYWNPDSLPSSTEQGSSFSSARFLVFNPLPMVRRDLVLVDLHHQKFNVQFDPGNFMVVDKTTKEEYPLTSVRDHRTDPGWDLPNFAFRRKGDGGSTNLFVFEPKMRGFGFQEFEVIPRTGAERSVFSWGMTEEEQAEAEAKAEEEEEKLKGEDYKMNPYAISRNSTFTRTPSIEFPCVLENARMRVRVNGKDGTVDVFDKKSSLLYSKLNRFILAFERGDSYYSTSDDLEAKVDSIEVDPAEKSAVLERCKVVMKISPSDDYQSTTLPIKLHYILARHSRRLEVRVEVEHKKKVEFRLRVKFPMTSTSISETEEMEETEDQQEVQAEGGTGGGRSQEMMGRRARKEYISGKEGKRTGGRSEKKGGGKEGNKPRGETEILDKLRVDGHFDLIDSESQRSPLHLSTTSRADPQLQFLDIWNEEKKIGYTVANRGLYEFQALQVERTIFRYSEHVTKAVYITLLRSSASMRDWIEIQTPTTRDLGDHAFEYCIIPHALGEQGKEEETEGEQTGKERKIEGREEEEEDDFRNGAEGRAFNAPLVAVQLKHYPNTLLADRSLVDLKNSYLSHLTRSGFAGDRLVFLSEKQEKRLQEKEKREKEEKKKKKKKKTMTNINLFEGMNIKSNASLPGLEGLLRLSPPDTFVLSALKKAHRNPNSLIVRIYSLAKSPTREQRQEESTLPITEGFAPEGEGGGRVSSFEFSVRPKEIQTFELELNKDWRLERLAKDTWLNYFPAPSPKRPFSRKQPQFPPNQGFSYNWNL